jgi:hypothetical protein
MGKHINFFGYTLWVSDDRKQPPDEAVPLGRCFYSPGVLATYCIVSNFSVGIFLYSINLSRRGYVWRGRLLAILSASFLIFLVFRDLFTGSFFELRSSFLINVLVAATLYGAEKSHFDRATRNGGKPARWWMPLIWIAIIVVIQFLLRFVLQMLLS